MKITEQGIELNEQQFYGQVSENDTTFVWVNGVGVAIFMINKNGSLFYHKKVTENPYFYNVEKVSITNNAFLVIERTRNLPAMIFMGIFVPIFALLSFLYFAFGTQFKQNGYGYNDNGKYEKKFVEVWI